MSNGRSISSGGFFISGKSWKTAVILSLWLLAGLSNVSAQDWPRFLGPHADGKSDETGLLDKWPEKGVPVVWDRVIGTGYGAPSVLGDRLVFHHRVRDEEVVECVNASTGETHWKYAYPSSYTDPYGYNNGPRCAPTLTSNLCYTFGAEGKLLCLELATGKLVWERNTDKDWNIPQAFFGVGSTPLLEGDLLIAMVGGQPDSGVVAFNAKTGKTVWESVGAKNWQDQPMLGWPGERTVNWQKYWKQASYSSPVAATINGQRQILCFMRQGLVSLNPKNGEVFFSRWFQCTVNDSVNAMNPMVVDDTILISAAYFRIGAVQLRVTPNGRGFVEVWRNPPEAIVADFKQLSLVLPSLETHWMTPIHLDGYLYAFSGRNEPDASFRCVEWKTGKLMWSRNERWEGHQHGAQPAVFGRGSMILAEGKLIAVGEGGMLGLFKPNPKEVEEISRWQIPTISYPCWAAPILSRKKLYVRSENHLVCLDLAKK